MRKLYFFILAWTFSLAVFSQRQPDKDFINQISQQETKSHENIFKVGNTKLGENYDLNYHRMHWFVDPGVNYISGSVTSYFTALSTINQLVFELNSALTIDSVKYHNNNLSFSHPDNTFTINFPSAIPAGTLDSVCVYYHGAPPQGAGFGSFIQSNHAGTPIIWTLSEPFGAPDWWPCKNSLTDKIDSIDIYVTTPNGNRVGSNGVLVSETVAGANKIFHWRHRYPIATYLIAIAITNYYAYSDYATLQNGTLEILNYVYPEDSVYARQNTPNLIPVIQLYDSLFSDYPYLEEKYGHAQFNWGGGMEHQTMTFLVNYGFDLMAHELAHQWFGDKVTCKSWHDIWINEGFATYLNGLAYYFLSNNAAWISWKSDNIFHITSEPWGSVYCDDTSSVSRIFDSRLSYAKGAMVLNMLRFKIGDSAFFACLKNYITDPLLVYGYADTYDFKAHAEAASGTNLTDFFNDWIYNQGYPIYTLNSTIHADSSVSINFLQSQSHASVSFFKLPVPVRFADAFSDTTIIFNNNQNNQTFDIHLNFFPTQITFDPEKELIAVLDTLIVNTSHINTSNDNIVIYPNPSGGVITINPGKLKPEIVRIFDISGGLVMESIPRPDGTFFKIDISHLNSGFYFIKILGSNNMITKKIVKL
ncbi:MAG TPA: M1 family aminopeptidase [Bacteroidales bacterium]|nr:M1 family aminopeptidase [Bacteroidales bacterium]